MGPPHVQCEGKLSLFFAILPLPLSPFYSTLLHSTHNNVNAVVLPPFAGDSIYFTSSSLDAYAFAQKRCKVAGTVLR